MAGRWRIQQNSIAVGLLAAVAHAPISLVQAQDGFADHDSSLPVEIEADDLVVRQAENKAIFSGNVDAIQGTLTLNADILTVYYRLSSNKDANGQPIERIEADGNVVITSPSETATGDNGVYDLLLDTMNLTGDVVLTRGDNVVEGSRLDIDLANDVATVKSDETDDTRVRALFQPAQQAQPSN